MKAIAEHLKALIEAEKENLHKLEAEKDRLYDEACELMKENPKESEELWKKGEKAYEAFNESYNKLRCLRHSLAYLRDALHEEYDHFQPEFDIQK